MPAAYVLPRTGAGSAAAAAAGGLPRDVGTHGLDGSTSPLDAVRDGRVAQRQAGKRGVPVVAPQEAPVPRLSPPEVRDAPADGGVDSARATPRRCRRP